MALKTSFRFLWPADDQGSILVGVFLGFFVMLIGYSLSLAFFQILMRSTENMDFLIGIAASLPWIAIAAIILYFIRKHKRRSALGAALPLASGILQLPAIGWVISGLLAILAAILIWPSRSGEWRTPAGLFVGLGFAYASVAVGYLLFKACLGLFNH